MRQLLEKTNTDPSKPLDQSISVMLPPSGLTNTGPARKKRFKPAVEQHRASKRKKLPSSSSNPHNPNNPSSSAAVLPPPEFKTKGRPAGNGHRQTGLMSLNVVKGYADELGIGGLPEQPGQKASWRALISAHLKAQDNVTPTVMPRPGSSPSSPKMSGSQGEISSRQV